MLTAFLEMNNRTAFIDFVRGLLNINPLERWSPQQAKLHPFITQQKFTGPFVPPMNLKSSSLNRSPAPGTQQQQQAEALSKQRAQAAQAQAQQAHQAQAHAQAQAQQNPYGSPMGPQYGHPQGHAQPQMYGGVYPGGGAVPNQSPGYGATQPYGQMVMQQSPQQIPPTQYGNAHQGNMYQQQGSSRTGRQRSSTMEQQQSGIPAAIQRVASHLDPTQPIRLQPSPAYYPPPPDGMAGMESSSGRPRRGSRAQGRNFVRTLEERTLEEGYMAGNQQQWH